MTITLPDDLAMRLVAVLERLAPADALPSPAQPTDGLLTLEDVALRLKKSKRDVQRLVSSGKLRKVAGLGAKTTRFRPNDVAKLLASPEELQVGRRML